MWRCSNNRVNATTNILLLEDNDDDAHLLTVALTDSGQIKRVTTKDAFQKHLSAEPCDVVIADQMIPGWSGMDAVQWVRETLPKLPCVLVSGIKDDSFAAEAIRGGASDFVYKGNLDRLPLVVIRVVNAAMTEDQLVRAQRLDAVGAVLSGMMHDLSGMMTLLPGALGIVRQKLDKPNEIAHCRKWLDVAEKTAGRVMEMMANIRVLLHGDRTPYTRLNLTTLLRQFAASVSAFLPKETELDVHIQEGDLFIQGNSSEVFQVLLNLVSNAQDAMPKGGTIRLSLDSMYLVDFPVGGKKLSGDFVLVSVSDTGFGMSQEVKRNIFNPLFTTKEHGTGIGLATSQRIMNSHNGRIDFVSQLGKGTTFYLYFNYVNGDRQPAQRQFDGDGRLVLIVDDELSVLEAMRVLVECNNYRVLTALNATEALAVYQANQADIAVVLTDILMPGVNGNTLMTALRALNPDVRIIVATGLPKTDSIDAEIVLQKPVTPGALFHALERAK